MKNPKISIIVPIYNIEKHLSRCLDSIISQTLPDIEIICVDDYSSDNSKSILDNYAKKDTRIIVIQHPKNKSIVQARKSGVQIAKGDYIIFVDGDDTIAPNACDILYKTMTETKVDICHFPTKVIGNTAKTDLRGIIEFVKPFHDALKEDNIFDACFIKSIYNWSIWNKIYEASLCKKAYQCTGDFYCNMAEDVYTYFIISYFGKSYLGIEGDQLYNYYFGLGMTGKHPNNGLIKLRGLCEQSRIPKELRKFLTQQNASKKYYDVVDRLEKKFLDESVWYWFTILSDSDCAEGFEILSEHWGSEEIIAFLAKTHYDKQEIIAQKILGSKSLQVKKETIKKIGVFYHRMRNGGVERVLSLLIPVWIDLGYSVVIFTDEEPTDNDFSLPDCVVRVVLPTSIGILPEETPKRIAALREGVLKHDIDVFIHNASTSPMLIFDLMVIKTIGIPAIVSSHECFSSSMFWRDNGIFKKVHVYKIADLLAVLTSVDHKFWTMFGIKTMLIPNPLFSDINNIRQSKLDTLNVIWVGRFAIEKQYIHPIHIFAEVVKEIPEAKLLILGKGESSAETAELRSEIERLGLSENVVLCGYFKDISHFYSMSSVYLSTSYHESFSMALIESRAYGIPSVAYELPNLDFFDEKSGVVIVPQGNKTAAAKAIIQMLGNEEFRIKKGMKARQSSEIFYKKNDVSNQWSKAINQITLGKELPVANSGNNEDIYLRIFQSVLLHYQLGLQSETRDSHVHQKNIEINYLKGQLQQLEEKFIQNKEALDEQNKEVLDEKTNELNEIKSSRSYKSFKIFKSLFIVFRPRAFVKLIRNKIGFNKTQKLIRNSGLFDEQYYLETNPDVKTSGLAALKHYHLYGGFEGRNPSEKFDTTFYLEQNADVKASGMNPLVHYIRFGRDENRKATIGQSKNVFPGDSNISTKSGKNKWKYEVNLMEGVASSSCPVRYFDQSIKSKYSYGNAIDHWEKAIQDFWNHYIDRYYEFFILSGRIKNGHILEIGAEFYNKYIKEVIAPGQELTILDLKEKDPPDIKIIKDLDHYYKFDMTLDDYRNNPDLIGKFDTVLSFGVLSCYDITPEMCAKYLDNLNGFLKPGGVAIIKVDKHAIEKHTHFPPFGTLHELIRSSFTISGIDILKSDTEEYVFYYLLKIVSE